MTTERRMIPLKWGQLAPKTRTFNGHVGLPTKKTDVIASRVESTLSYSP